MENDGRADRETEGWEDKHAERWRENVCKYVLKRYLLCFLLHSYGVKTHRYSHFNLCAAKNMAVYFLAVNE